MRIGLLTILIGVTFLLKNLGLLTDIQWEILWPVMLIYIGVAMVTRHRCWHCGIWHDGKDLHKKGMTCDCDECTEGTKKRSR
ncbi:MAG: hypothetical protein K0S38_439 [Candidatus Paceibacter sp.]|jgi:hypothetical protein|nr:hypothetical protein [Candidatus Paceibacter sp.]